MNVAQETLGLRRAGLSPALSLLMSAFALPIPPASLTRHLHRPTERSPTTSALIFVHSHIIRPVMGRFARLAQRQRPVACIAHTTSQFITSLELDCGVALGRQAHRYAHSEQRRALTSTASAHGLSPVTSSAQDDSTSELLRFL